MENELACKVTVLSFLPIAVSLIALLISILSYIKNLSVTRDNILQNIKLNIDTAKSHYDKLCMENVNLKAKKNKSSQEISEFELKKEIENKAFENILNAYEDGCDKFFKNKVNKKDFKEKYHEEIVKIVEENEDEFSGPLTSYYKILDYYKRNHKMINN